MPSPLGHTLAGLAVGWFGSAPARPGAAALRDNLTPAVLGCACLAALPDADLLIPHFHRTATHSVTATALVLIITAAVTAQVTGRIQWRLALCLAAAHATHLLMDWLGFDHNPPPGLQLLWPFDPTFYISGWDWFPATAREHLTWQMLSVNLYAAVFETVSVGPVALAAWASWRWRSSQA